MATRSRKPRSRLRSRPESIRRKGIDVDSNAQEKIGAWLEVWKLGRRRSRWQSKDIDTLSMRVPSRTNSAASSPRRRVQVSRRHTPFTSIEDGYASAMSLTWTLACDRSGVLCGAARLHVRLLQKNNSHAYPRVLEQIREIGRGGGDLTRSITVRSSDEIGQLGVAINRFTSKLREIILQSRIMQPRRWSPPALFDISRDVEEYGVRCVQTSSVAKASEEMAATSTRLEQVHQVAQSSKQASASAVTEARSSSERWR